MIATGRFLARCASLSVLVMSCRQAPADTDAQTADAATLEVAEVPDAPDGAMADGAPEDVVADVAAEVASSSSVTWLATELLGRPSAEGVTLNLVPANDAEAYVELGTAPDVYAVQTAPQSSPAGEPLVFDVNGLTGNTRYFYRVRFRAPGEAAFAALAPHSFHTARPPGETFVFTVQADSHMDDKSSVAIYHQTLQNALAAQPDFHIDLGDTFMCEKHSAPLQAEVKPAPDLQTVITRYLYERQHFGLIAHSTPLFLVNGNHEGEIGYLNDGTPNNLAVWTTLARKRYFPNPQANPTYTTPQGAEPIVGQRQHPYAWQWGDALFVALDPFWFTKSQVKQGNRWTWTLGKAQYDWLRATLEASNAKYKFVFAHHIVGGTDSASRGGIEMAPFFEWGGKEADGTYTFDKNRPGWGKPIHQLFVDTHVSAFFHGHDHVFVRQELDGVVYQEVPQPSATNTANGAQLATEGGYVAGTILSSSGHMRITVAPDQAKVEYVRTWLPADAASGKQNGSVDNSYTIAPH